MLYHLIQGHSWTGTSDAFPYLMTQKAAEAVSAKLDSKQLTPKPLVLDMMDKLKQKSRTLGKFDGTGPLALSTRVPGVAWPKPCAEAFGFCSRRGIS